MVHVKTLPGEPLFAITVIPVTHGRFVGISCSDAIADFVSLIIFCFAWKCVIEGNDFRFLQPRDYSPVSRLVLIRLIRCLSPH